MNFKINENSLDFIKNSIYKYVIINNVKSYECLNYEIWDIYNNEDIIKKENDNIQYYLIIDLPQNRAFAHWIYESAIYLPLFNILKTQYPNIKIHLKTIKDYKKIFMKYFNILEDDYTLDMNENNICIFPLPISCLNNVTVTPDYVDLVNKFIYELNIPNIKEKKYNILLSPRGKKENLVENDRLCNVDDIINNLNENVNNYVLYTDGITDITEQIQIFSSSKNIILIDGSAYLVNGIFCNNSNIVILGNCTESQMKTYKKLQLIHDLIIKNNKVIHLPYMNGNFNSSIFKYDDIKDYLI